jgi:taurine transport system permease protein
MSLLRTEAIQVIHRAGLAAHLMNGLRSRLTFVSTCATFGAIALVWWGVTASGLVPEFLLPPPANVLRQAAALSTDGYVGATLAQHAAASLGRISVALVLAVLTGIPAGLAIGLSGFARGSLGALVDFYRPIPPLAYLPLMVIWFGIGELSKVILIYLAILAPIVVATSAGVRQATTSQINAARSLGASRSRVILFVILPAALPSIMTGTQIGLGAGWATLVAAELVAATRGLGFMVQSASQYLVTDVVILGILVIAVLAFAFELTIRALRRTFVPWEGRE